jgi:ABC-type molybdate transport system substrate-binding protein
MMRGRRLAAAFLFLATAVAAGTAGAAELKMLSVDAMKPALQQLAPALETAAKSKLTIEYASAADIAKKMTAEEPYDVVILDKATTTKLIGGGKLAGGLSEPLAKDYVATSTNWTDQPLAVKALVDFLGTPKSKEVYKANGLQG